SLHLLDLHSFPTRRSSDLHQGILYGSSSGFSTPNKSDKNCPNQYQMCFQSIGLLPLYRCSRCQIHFDSAGHKSVLSRLLCYLSISASFGFSIYLFGICYTTGLRCKPVSNHWLLSWRPCNHVRWKRTDQTGNNRCPTIALYRGCHEQKNFRQGTNYCYDNTYKNRGCCQRTYLAFSVLC